jgi:hypothetical protein
MLFNRCLQWESYETHKYKIIIEAGGAYSYHWVLGGWI